jgi:hypothetical protein
MRSVDWARTKAYAVGIGSVYLNLKGREGEGIVAPDEAAGGQPAIEDGAHRTQGSGHRRGGDPGA